MTADEQIRAVFDAVIRRVASRVGCPDRMVTIGYENGYSSPGEASWLWSISVEQRSGDRRKRPNQLSGSGDSLEEAEAALVRALCLEEQIQDEERARRKGRTHE